MSFFNLRFFVAEPQIPNLNVLAEDERGRCFVAETDKVTVFADSSPSRDTGS